MTFLHQIKVLFKHYIISWY